ncbi:MAG: hypothetical protein AAF615_04265 [Pseudomonadota bacterium]
MSASERTEDERTEDEGAAAEEGPTPRDPKAAAKAIEHLQRAANILADEGMSAASEELSRVAKAARSASETLAEGREGSAAKAVNEAVSEAAQEVDRLAGTLSRTTPSALLTSIEDLARRNPALFLVGAVAAGVALGRFARASAGRVTTPKEARPSADARQDDKSIQERADSTAAVRETPNGNGEP